jgi:two-component system, OmpR family, response regulator
MVAALEHPFSTNIAVHLRSSRIRLRKLSVSSPSKSTIVVVDDEPAMRDMLLRYLGSQGFRAIECIDTNRVQEVLVSEAAQVLLLDVNLGDADGFRIANGIRKTGVWHGGIIMLTGRVDLVDRVVGLEIGADDYIVKPFELRELSARISSLIRRLPASSQGNPSTEALVFADFALAPTSRTLTRRSNGAVVPLTTAEFDLLSKFVQDANRVLSRDQLMQSMHGRSADPLDRTIDVLIGRLRKKLGDDPRQPELIKSVRNVGYLFACAVQRAAAYQQL